jgi:VanZ like family
MRWIRIAFGLAVVVQCWTLYVPRPPSVESGLPLDKVVHLGLFALVTWLGLKAGWRWVIPLMVAQAAASELIQLLFLPNRGGDWWDFTADLLGIALGWGLARVTTLTPADT